MITVNRILFSHAEMGEDVVEGFLRSDLAACDFCQGVDDLAEVFGKEVSTKFCLEARDDTLEVGMGTGEGIVVAGIGDDDVGGGDGRDVGGRKDGSF